MARRPECLRTLARLGLTAVAPSLLGCLRETSRPASPPVEVKAAAAATTQSTLEPKVTWPSEHRLSVSLYSRLEKPSHWDGAAFSYSRFDAPRFATTARVSRVLYLKLSPSIAAEQDRALLAVEPGERVSGHPGCTEILIYFDRDQYRKGVFKAGDRWQLEFSTDGRLVNLYPFTRTSAPIP